MNKNKKWLAALVAALMLAACMGCKAEAVPPYLIVDGTTVTGHTKDLPANLVIPKGITKIAGGSFAGCDWLESVTIPNSVTEIGGGAFTDRNNIVVVAYNGTLKQWCQMDNDGDLVSNAKIIRLSDVENLKALTTLTIPNGVTKIGKYAFYGCTSLASVTIPNSVTKIGYWAFSGYDNIVVVAYNGTLKQWCQMDNNDYNLVRNAKIIRLSDVENLKALTTLTIPNGVTKIGKYAFYGCTSLASVTIPNSVTKIGYWAFSGYNNIVVVTYNGTLKQWCQMDNYGNLVRNAKIIRLSDTENLKALTTLTIPNGVTKIGGGAFSDCTSLASVTIPNSMTEIGGGAFFGCDNIVEVTYNGTLKQWCQMDNDGDLVSNAKIIRLSDAENLKALITLTIPNGVTKIGLDAFSGCTSLASVTIPNSVTEIGYWAFSGCTSLASVTIPNSVTKIGLDAFFGCDNIVEVTYNGTFKQWCQMDNDGGLVRNAKIIRLSDVENLKALTTLTIPNGVTEIGTCAFYGCTSLASVTIPNSVTKIGYRAFYDCTSLASVTYTGTKAQWGALENGYFWNSSVPATAVRCADGDAAL